MTNREFLQTVANTDSLSAEVRDFAKAAIDKLDNKLSSRAAKEREKKTQENAPLVAQLLEVLADGKFKTTADIATAMGVHPSKVTALAKGLVEDGTLTKDKVSVPKKGKQTAYCLADLSHPVSSEQEAE